MVYYNNEQIVGCVHVFCGMCVCIGSMECRNPLKHFVSVAICETLKNLNPLYVNDFKRFLSCVNEYYRKFYRAKKIHKELPFIEVLYRKVREAQKKIK